MDYLNFNKACQRSDGSIYGIEDGKQCRKGSPITLDAKTVNLAYKKAKEKGARPKDLEAITDKVKKSFPDGFSSSDSKIALINELNSFKPKTLSSRLKDVKGRTLAKGKELREALATKIKSRVKLIKEREEAAKGAREWGLTRDQELEIFSKAMEKFPIKDKTRASVRASKEAFVEATKNYKKYSEEAKNKSDQELREVLSQIKEKGINPSAIANAREKVSKKFTNLNTKEAREALVAELRKELESKPTLSSKVVSQESKVKELKTPESNKVPGGFPEPSDLDKLEVVKKLGGSTGAILVRDPITGREYVKKTGSSPDHIREEFYAEEAYRALGISVPKSTLYEGETPIKLSEYLPNARPLNSLTGKEKEDAITKIKEGFAVDALMGNWDSVGLSQDNILVDSEGKPWRVDVGGSLRFRAQGAMKKEDQWNEYPTELWSMRESGQGKDVYGSLSIGQISDQIRNLDQASVKKALASLPVPLRETVGRRVEEAQRIAKIQDTLTKDEFKDDYVNEFTRHSLGLRNSGLIDRLPTKFTPDANTPYKWVDENGKIFDNLRGEDSLVSEWEKYCNSSGGNPEIIAKFYKAQASSSWSPEAAGFKYWFSNQQNPSPESTYFWLNASNGDKGIPAYNYAKKQFSEMFKKNYSEDQIKSSFAAFHAFTYEQLQRYDMPNNYRDRGTIGAIRTINWKLLYGKNVGDKGLGLRQGVAESYSMFYPFSLNGTEVIVQEVPHHRVMGMFFQTRPGSNRPTKGLFAEDHENEFLVMQRGIPATWVGPSYKFSKEGEILYVEDVI